MTKNKTGRKKRVETRPRKKIKTVGLSDETWIALKREAKARGISRNQWLNVIVSHRHLIEKAEENGLITIVK